MDQVHQFAYGWITPGFAYALSFLGSLLGLVSTARARAATDQRRRAWLLVLAAWAIGGTGIWVMHFAAMIGFSVSNTPLRYDVPITIASFFIAVITVGAGLFIVGYGPPTTAKVLIGGPITGVSVAFMHYTGMYAMRVNGSFDYDRRLVVASYAIAMVATTVALWFTVVVRGLPFTFAAAAVMGLAVCGMHYTGMYAMRVHLKDAPHDVPGVDVNWFVPPIMLFILMVVIALASAFMAVPSERDQRREDDLLRSTWSGEGIGSQGFGDAPAVASVNGTGVNGSRSGWSGLNGSASHSGGLADGGFNARPGGDTAPAGRRPTIAARIPRRTSRDG